MTSFPPLSPSSLSYSICLSPFAGTYTDQWSSLLASSLPWERRQGTQLVSCRRRRNGGFRERYIYVCGTQTHNKCTNPTQARSLGKQVWQTVIIHHKEACVMFVEIENAPDRQALCYVPGFRKGQRLVLAELMLAHGCHCHIRFSGFLFPRSPTVLKMRMYA